MITKELIIKNYLSIKNTYCYDDNLLDTEEKEILKKFCDGEATTYIDEFFNLIIDEVSILKKFKTESYVFTYKQVQAIVFCCRYLGLNVDVEINIDLSNIDFSYPNITREYIYQQIDSAPIEYIKIKRIK